jgi:hypothetical protein
MEASAAAQFRTMCPHDLNPPELNARRRLPPSATRATVAARLSRVRRPKPISDETRHTKVLHPFWRRRQARPCPPSPPQPAKIVAAPISTPQPRLTLQRHTRPGADFATPHPAVTFSIPHCDIVGLPIQVLHQCSILVLRHRHWIAPDHDNRCRTRIAKGLGLD